jgi:hypothetical protein
MDTNTTNMFETASRSKLRFSFKGLISTEDLWDLPVESLDMMYKSLNAQAKQAKEESLLGTRSKQEEELTLRIELIKHVVKTKIEEADAKVKDIEARRKKQKLMEILASKQDSDLQTKSVEELTKMIEELE